MTKIVAISDTHELHRKLEIPDGDVLIHCGDIINSYNDKALIDFINWMSDLPHKHKIVIPGNHDMILDPVNKNYTPNLFEELFERNKIHYLLHNSVVLDDLKFHGTSWIPSLPGWAFYDGNRNRFQNIPDDTNILITHSPPYKIRDWSETPWGKDHYGSGHLLNKINELKTLNNLKAHFFGHCHQAYGIHENDGIKFVNAAICNENYRPLNPIQIVDI